MSASPKVRFLLVEDDEVDVEAIRRAFEKSGVGGPLEVAGEGRQALQRMRAAGRSAVWVVLLDLSMPGMNGLEFLSHLRRDAALRRTVVFVLTSSRDPQDIRRSYDFNVAGYVVKSHDPDHLVDVAGMLDRYRRVVELP